MEADGFIFTEKKSIIVKSGGRLPPCGALIIAEYVSLSHSTDREGPSTKAGGFLYVHTYSL